MLKKLLYRAGAPLWRLGGRLVPKKANWVVLCTFPDFDDTVRSLQRAAALRGYALKLLLSDPCSRAPAWLDPSITEVRRRLSLRGLWVYHRSRIAIFSHGLFSWWEPNPRQHVVNIWHGMPVKRIGRLDHRARDAPPRAHYTIAYDEAFRPVIAAAFGMPLERVLRLVHPRVDGLSLPDSRRHPWQRLGRLVLWLPTYRASRLGDVRVDGEFSLRQLARDGTLAALDAIMARHEAVCVIKPHPMSVDEVCEPALARVVILAEAQLASSGFTLYELLARASLLVTDISSVYFDFRTTGRPVVIFFPDIEAYRAERGFVLPLEQLLAEQPCVSVAQFLAQVDTTLAAPEAVAVPATRAPTTSAASEVLPPLPVHGLALFAAIEQLEAP